MINTRIGHFPIESAAMNAPAPPAADHRSGAPQRPRRQLTRADRAIRAPLGLLWLGCLLVLAIPVAVYMTVLYYVVRLARSPDSGRIARRDEGEAPGRRVA